jgi:Nitrate reductase delta subunit
VRTENAGRWELLRALGAVADSPAAARAVGPALGLDLCPSAAHTDVFVLNCPPYASVYLGPEGALGGEGTDRVAGFWRAIGITPPAEPDHLTALLGLYARLGEAAAESRREVTAATLARSQGALLAEHLWPWLPAYLDAVTELDAPALTAWAHLTQRALAAELSAPPLAQQPSLAQQLPLALRAAPGPVAANGKLGDLIDAVTTPIRSGMILTRHRLALGAGQAAVGHRIGERRFTLRAMLEQDPAATLGWLSAEACRWEQRHASRAGAVSRWWSARAAHTSRLLAESASAAGAALASPAGESGTDASGYRVGPAEEPSLPTMRCRHSS